MHSSWKRSRILLWRYYRNLLSEKWWVIFSSGRTTFMIFFFFQFLSRLTERSRSKNSCNQIKLNKASFLTSASNNWKFCRATSILGNFLLNYIMSTQWTQVLSQSFFKPSNTRTQKSESFSCTVRNHLWLRATNCGKTSFSLFHSNVMQYYTIMEPFKKKKQTWTGKKVSYRLRFLSTSVTVILQYHTNSISCLDG